MLKELREKAGLSQSQLSKKTGISIITIQHYEQGVRDIKKAQAETVQKIAKVLGKSMEEVIE